MISNAEMDRRWSLVRSAMEREGYDWLIATTGHPFGYYRWLTNRTGLSAPLAAIGTDGPVLFVSHGDEVHHQPHDSYGVRHIATCSQPNLYLHSHAPALVQAMRERPVRRIGILGAGFFPLAAYTIIREAFPNARLDEATDLIAPLKALKSAEEMQLMRAASAMHDDLVELAMGMVRPGVRPKDIVDAVRSEAMRRGSPMQTLMAGAAPPGTICKYAGPADREMQAGDQFAMLIECCEANGYYSEAMPTACIGEIPRALQKAFDEVVQIQEELAAMVRPGLLPSELLAANDRFMAAHGYPAERRLLGHSQGYDLVERPGFSPGGENLPIEPGMVISIHPTVHAPQAWGYPNNMSFHFSADGMTRMLKTPQKIFVV